MGFMKKSSLFGMLVCSFLLVSFAAPRDAHAGDFGFSLGHNVGAFNFLGGTSISNTGTRIGYRMNQLHFYGTLDYARIGTNTEFQTTTTDQNGNQTTETREVDASISLATLGAGTRFFFQDPTDADREVIPYANGTLYTLLPAASVEDQELSDFVSITSFGFLAGFGADYFFTDQFSIGGEFGASGLFLNADVENSETKNSVNALEFYTGIQFSFYL